MSNYFGSEELRNATGFLDRRLDAGSGPDLAIVNDDERLTYDDLAGLVAQAAASFTSIGLQREQRVLMVLDDSPAFYAAFLGAIRVGGVPVPVNPMDRVDSYGYYLADSSARVAVIEAELLPKLSTILSVHRDVSVLAANGEAEDYPRFETTLADQSPQLLAPVDTHRDDMAFWLYSSGSTGRPKGVVHSQTDIAATVETYSRHVLRVGSDDVCYSTTKLFHAYGLGNSLSFPLAAGGTAVTGRGRPDPRAILETIEARQPTLFFSVPALYAAMLTADPARTDFSSVRCCISAAEPLPEPVFRRWQAATGRPILDGIGSTEMLHIYCSNTLDDLVPGTSGKPVPGYALRLVGDSGEDLAANQAGDLLVKGDSCAMAYWHQREKSRRCMRGEWFYTGDRYLRTGDGHFVYQGRADDMIKVGGLWVSPADVEACLVSHDAVSEAAVILATVENRSRIEAFVICREPPADQAALADELRAWCKDRLRRYEYPHIVTFVTDFPRTATGKVQRFKLREARSAGSSEDSPPQLRAIETPR